MNKPNFSNRFKLIGDCDLTTYKEDGYHRNIIVYYDTETKVMYQLVEGHEAGSVSVMYNADGTVMLYNDANQ